ncbi:MAG: acyl carrier protein [Actinomycetota bacterium]
MASSISTEFDEILREELAIDTSRLTRESHLIDDVGLDSVAFAVGMVAIEDKLGVALTESELMECSTVADLEDMVFAKRG